MLLLLVACTYISAEEHAARLAALDAGTDTDTTTTPDLRVEALDPAFGTDAGGTVVTLTGGPFDDSTEVFFGTGRADVLDVTPDVLTVRTPDSAAVGPVTVTVAGSGGSVRRDAAYTYWADATGRVGATGELVYFSYVGGYWDKTQVDYARSTVRFTEGLDYQYFLYWAPELDTCTRITNGVAEYVYDPVPVALDALGGTLTQRADSTAIDLSWSSAEQRFTAYDLDLDKYAPGEAYDLVLKDTPGLPEIELLDAFPAPAPFDVDEPPIFSENIPFVTEDQHFAWNTDVTGDAVLLQLGLVNATDDAFEQEIFCALRDVGSFTPPAGTWTRWAPGRTLNILIGRTNSGDGLIPWNQGSIGTAITWWNYGAGNTR